MLARLGDGLIKHARTHAHSHAVVPPASKENWTVRILGTIV